MAEIKKSQVSQILLIIFINNNNNVPSENLIKRRRLFDTPSLTDEETINLSIFNFYVLFYISYN